MQQIAILKRRNSVGRNQLADREVQDLGDFVAANLNALLRLAFVLCGDSDEARDIVQSVLLRLQERDLTAVENLAAFATRATTNEFLNRKRRQRLWDRTAHRLWTHQIEPSSDHWIAERDALAAVLNRLSPRQRAAITLRYWADLSDSQIAEHLGCREATVRSLIARSLPILRTGLTEAEERER